MNTAKKAALVLAATGVTLGGAAGSAFASGADASGAAIGSPGVVSGNNIQVPVAIPIQVVGNSINVVGILNPVFGNAGFIR
ncbi:chaplin [Streptomyces hainanensis]|uniref:Chaplin n=1 Tax=Streptomyces hainanensis TaxID=402648 RepID=A0A4R4T9I6_9ACTN|nr:chaplin [Streptomyces hainanensis]TDC73757.1 chaplin [Streptomyces hainanensis]